MKKFSKTTGISIVIASMVGTGVFTSLGFQLLGIQSFFVLMLLWFVGGITALCGALTYAELGASLPRSGGEYNFLGQLYHPCAGFISGWISATVGFAGPVALAAMTFGAYLSAIFPELPRTGSALTLVAILTVVHCFSRQVSGDIQKLFTALKVLLILLFCVVIFIWGTTPQEISFAPTAGDKKILFSGAFAIALIYVNYAYTGWSAVTCVISELDDVQRNLPIILLIGTITVMLVYLLLNFTFLSAAPISSLKGKLEVGVIVAEHALGNTAGKAMGAILALLLISTVSAMTMAGPRVLKVIGEDFQFFSKLSHLSTNGIPTNAIIFQSLLASSFIISATFESVLVFSSFVLGINTLFAVLGVFVLRYKKLNIDGAYRTFSYPIAPLIYLGITLWTLIYVSVSKPQEAGMGIAIILSGGIIYLFSVKVGATKTTKQDN
ncbi:MAG: APC family permease [Sphingomonadales bacterium]|jgi:APA family basic amino acid/polyamine antiporter